MKIEQAKAIDLDTVVTVVEPGTGLLIPGKVLGTNEDPITGVVKLTISHQTTVVGIFEIENVNPDPVPVPATV